MLYLGEIFRLWMSTMHRIFDCRNYSGGCGSNQWHRSVAVSRALLRKMENQVDVYAATQTL